MAEKNNEVLSCEDSQKLFDREYADIDIVHVPLRFSVPSKKIRSRIEVIVGESSLIADVGCGHGGTAMIFAGMNTNATVTGLDFSEIALNKLRKYAAGLSNIRTLRVDLLNGSLPKEAYDFVYCSQVIEHFEDDGKLLENLTASLRPGGQMFVGTIFKNKGARYFYRNKYGESAIHPDHVNEYVDKKVLFSKAENCGLEILEHDLSIAMYPAVDVLLKGLTKLSKSRLVWHIANSKITMFLRSITSVPIPGYYIFQILMRKKI